MINNDAELMSEPCPKCGERQLKLAGALSFAEINSLFGGGG